MEAGQGTMPGVHAAISWGCTSSPKTAVKQFYAKQLVSDIAQRLGNLPFGFHSRLGLSFDRKLHHNRDVAAGLMQQQQETVSPFAAVLWRHDMAVSVSGPV
jgi:hypothetical protein